MPMVVFKSLIALKYTDKFRREQQIASLYWMGFFWSASTIILVSTLPLFLTNVLKLRHMHIGAIEGFVVFLSFVTKVFVGMASDLLQDRRPFILLGSFLGLITRPIIPLSASVMGIFCGRSLDRISKGMRASPVDAFLADLSSSDDYGQVYGLKYAFSQAGAVTGASFAMLLIKIYADNLQVIFWISCIPSLIAFVIGLVTFGVVVPKFKKNDKSFTSIKVFSLSQIKKLSFNFWAISLVATFLMMSRFSEVFLVFRARDLGFKDFHVPIIFIIIDFVQIFVAITFGKLSDYQICRKRLVFFGMMLFVFTHYLFYQTHNTWSFILGIICIGVHMGITQGGLKAIIATYTKTSIRGCAFSVFNLMCGVGILLGNFAAGCLSEAYGLKYIFLFGVACSFLAAIGVALLIVYEKSCDSQSVVLSP
jgi:MFS family permease